jgi:hypothetical protein
MYLINNIVRYINYARYLKKICLYFATEEKYVDQFYIVFCLINVTLNNKDTK